MKKDGFIFVETIVVLVVLMGGVLALYTTYNIIITNIERRSNFDSISDLYKLDALRSMINLDSIENNNFIVNINKSNCASYMNDANCSLILEGAGINNLYLLTTSVSNILSNSQIDSYYPSFIEYTKTLNSDNGELLIIGEFNYNDKRHYASLTYRRL